MAFEETESQSEVLNALSSEAHNWDCFIGIQEDINNIRVRTYKIITGK